MVRSLTKLRSDGTPYTRPAEVERQITRALTQDVKTLATRAALDRSSPNHLSSECLVYLIREGRRTNNDSLMSALIPMLLQRCEACLLKRVSDRGFSNAGDIRQSILDDLVDVFLHPTREDQLDFYECRFNRAFQALRVDAIRRRRRPREVPASQCGPATAQAGEPDGYPGILGTLASKPDTFGVEERAELLRLVEELLDADERQALALRHMGYPVESENPGTTTIATLCGVSGRTIRTRLAKAEAKIAQLREEA